MVSLLADRRVYRSIMKLQSMGLAVHLEELGGDRVLVLIDGESILRYVMKKIDRSVVYPRKRIVYDRGNNIIRIEMWRGRGVDGGGEEKEREG